LRRLDAALRLAVALLGTWPLTTLLLSLLVRGVLGGAPAAEALAPVLLVPCWLIACCTCMVARSGVRATGWVALTTAAAALLLHLAT
jgi:hypothetical protein